MTLRIISAEDILFEGTVAAVTLPGSEGAFTVLSHHASLISTLASGEVRYVMDGGAEKRVNIEGGIVDVDNDIVSVCVY
ncbi:MAG: hypothetical protein K2O12_06815 [Muribaculaceae bacterium]|nr:hypothetical protein [Muribaculaceae bacterium]